MYKKYKSTKKNSPAAAFSTKKAKQSKTEKYKNSVKAQKAKIYKKCKNETKKE